MITNQAFLFLVFTIDGSIISLLYDIFRILRKSFKTPNFVTYIEDIIFWILTGFLVLYSIFIFNNGEIRLFMFLGIIIGIMLYMLFFSKYVMSINLFIIKKIKNLTKNIKKIIEKSENKEDFKNKSRIK